MCIWDVSEKAGTLHSCFGLPSPKAEYAIHEVPQMLSGLPIGCSTHLGSRLEAIFTHESQGVDGQITIVFNLLDVA